MLSCNLYFATALRRDVRASEHVLLPRVLRDRREVDSGLPHHGGVRGPHLQLSHDRREQQGKQLDL